MKKYHQSHIFAGLMLQYECNSTSALTIPLLRRNNALKREGGMIGLNVQVIVYHLVSNCVYYMFIILKIKLQAYYQIMDLVCAGEIRENTIREIT